MRGGYESDMLNARSCQPDRELAFNARFASCCLVNERRVATTLLRLDCKPLTNREIRERKTRSLN